MTTLIIAEKPSVAKRISSALGESVRVKRVNGVSVFEFSRGGETFLVVPAVGHLFNLKHVDSGEEGVGFFDLVWVPAFKLRKESRFTKRYYDVFKGLRGKVSDFIVATDYDHEGEVIGFVILKELFGVSDAKRMKFSALTKEDLKRSFENLQGSLDKGLLEAGLVRHFVDYFWGVNFSKVLTDAVKEVGRFKLLSVGRVQGPALKLVVDKEREVRGFVPEKFWDVFVKVLGFELRFNRFSNKGEAERVRRELLGSFLRVDKVVDGEQFLKPFPNFNLLSLQTEAYKCFGFPPKKCLDLAQSLYEKGLISYPRTSSERIPSSVDCKRIVDKLVKGFGFKLPKLTKLRSEPVQGVKSDPAHPAIHPTGEVGELSGDEEKLFFLIVKRFLGSLSEDAQLFKRKIVFSNGLSVTCKQVVKGEDDKKPLFGKKRVKSRFLRKKGGQRTAIEGVDKGGCQTPLIGEDDKKPRRGVLCLSVTCKQVVKKGWLSVYDFHKVEEVRVVDVREGESVRVDDVVVREGVTKPPKRFSQAGLIKRLDSLNLGTKATRTLIVQTLYDRGYVSGVNPSPTSLGERLVEVLEKYLPELVSVGLTRDLEEKLVLVERGELSGDVVLEECKRVVVSVLKRFCEVKKLVGEELLSGVVDDLNLFKCPVCGKGFMRVFKSRKSGKRFLGCTNYPSCTNSHPLPSVGLINVSSSVCDGCGYSMLVRVVRGKRPWLFCPNINCPSKK